MTAALPSLSLSLSLLTIITFHGRDDDKAVAAASAACLPAFRTAYLPSRVTMR